MVKSKPTHSRKGVLYTDVRLIDLAELSRMRTDRQRGAALLHQMSEMVEDFARLTGIHPFNVELRIMQYSQEEQS